MRWLRPPRPFAERVTWLVTVTSGLAILVVSFVLSISHYFDTRSDLVTRVAARSQIVAMNSSAPLAFDDRRSGADAVRTLEATGNVASATLFDADGTQFASYQRAGDPGPVFALQPVGTDEHEGWKLLVLRIEDELGFQGHLQVAYDLKDLDARVAGNSLLMIAVALAAMMLTYITARGLKDVLTRPVVELANAARSVSATRDYGVRARKFGDDELGELTDTFNEMLAQIQQQDAEIKAARGEAERASRMKDEFLATLSHELRTPMTPILGWAQILRRSPDISERVLQGAEVIERNARVQTKIIDELLDMSRIVAGKLRLDVQAVDLAEVIDAAVATTRPAAEARDIRVETALAPIDGVVRGDPSRLQQIVWNLLSNAIKFTDRGGRVRVELRGVDGRAEIAVSDTGQGIAEEFLPHVFERFRQGDSSTTRSHGGLGLGLAIVRQLVELHGGTVSAGSSGLGHGATFTVTLPLLAMRSDAISGAAAAADGDVMLPGVRVLAVDDESDVRTLLANLLESRGAIVVGVDSAQAALQMIGAFRPDVLISDIGMPVSDGYELIQKVRALPPAQGGATLAIALTAFAGAVDRERALAAGYQRHVSKPVDATELIGVVAGLVQATESATRKAGLAASS